MLLCDTILLIVTIAVVLIGALMALLVGLVLPDHDLMKTPSGPSGDSGNKSAEHVLSRGEHVKMSRKAGGDLFEMRNDHRTPPTVTPPWLVSITATRFIDAPWSIRFLCVGTIISRTMVLTGDDCIRSPLREQDFQRATVVFEPKQWFQGTQSYSVISYHSSCEKADKAECQSPYHRLYVLRVTGFQETVHPPTLSSPSAEGKPRRRLSYGWGADEDPRENSLKYDALSQEHYILYSSEFKSKLWCNESKGHSFVDKNKCKAVSIVTSDIDGKCSLIGRPLIEEYDGEDYFLMGMEINISTEPDFASRKQFFRKFLDLRDERFLNWIKKFVKKDLNEVGTTSGKNELICETTVGYYYSHQMAMSKLYAVLYSSSEM